MRKNTIIEASRELTGREKLLFLKTSAAQKIDEITENGPVTVKPVDYALISCSSDNEADENYNKIVIVSDDGQYYTSGSSSFIESFLDIYNAMKDDPEDYLVEFSRQPSKNRPGKYFLACNIM